HEAYPGHHAHYVAMDRELFRKRGWSEYGVGIDSDPLVPVAEAIAEHGVSLAFPIEERIAFERDVLYPILGRKMQNEEQWRAFFAARPALLGSTATIARDFIENRIDEETAVQRLIRYRLQTPEAARQTVKMLKAFGAYLIASDFGWYAVDRAMKKRNLGEQWRLLKRMQREPMLLADILKL
ncbi:MAG TPA: hypothetical protein VD768_06890, partial [Sphingomicrobium sp.]|nr:hypothetical protein [Sphingomicrobium sp.]